MAHASSLVRKRLSFLTHLLTVVVTFSYLTLGVFATQQAEHLWAPYAGVVLVLAAFNLHGEHRAERP
jgi:hypothetical protein